jgi:hypothetical protein
MTRPRSDIESAVLGGALEGMIAVYPLCTKGGLRKKAMYRPRPTEVTDCRIRGAGRLIGLMKGIVMYSWCFELALNMMIVSLDGRIAVSLNRARWIYLEVIWRQG